MSSFIFFVVTMASFTSTWMKSTGIVLPVGFNQIILFLGIALIWLIDGRRILISKEYGTYIFLMLVYLIISTVFLENRFMSFIIGFCFTFEFVIIFVFASNTVINRNELHNIMKFSAFGILSLSFISVPEIFMKDISLRDAFTVFREVGAYGGAMCIVLIIFLTLYLNSANKYYFALSVVSSALIISTILKKSIISMIIIWLLYYFWFEKKTIKNKILFIISLLAIVISLNYFMNYLLSNISANASIFKNSRGDMPRIVLYRTAFRIIIDYFPFGSGLGTYGSVASIWKNYSDVYYQYGISKIYSMTPQDVANGSITFFDAYWTHILGELGFIGTIIFMCIWSFPVKNAFKFYSKELDPFEKSIIFFMIAIFIDTSIEGFAYYYPENSSFILFHSGLMGFVFYYIKNFKKYEKAELVNNDGPEKENEIII